MTVQQLKILYPKVYMIFEIIKNSDESKNYFKNFPHIALDSDDISQSIWFGNSINDKFNITEYFWSVLHRYDALSAEVDKLITRAGLKGYVNKKVFKIKLKV